MPDNLGDIAEHPSPEAGDLVDVVDNLVGEPK
jgi:hypothetical protein